MMAGPKVEFDLDPRALERIKQAFRDLPRGPARRAVNKATRQAAKPILARVKSTAPRDTGAMTSETGVRNFRAKSAFGGAFAATPSRKRLAGLHTNRKGGSTKRQERIRSSRKSSKRIDILNSPWYYPAVVQKRTQFMTGALAGVSGAVRGILPSLFLKHLDEQVEKYRAKKGLQ